MQINIEGKLAHTAFYGPCNGENTDLDDDNNNEDEYIFAI